MKNIFKTLLITTITLFVSLNATAGKIKNILIDAEDAMIQKLSDDGESNIDSITNHKFVNFPEGIAIQATASSFSNEWTCIAYFTKNSEDYVLKSVVCK